MNTTLGRHTRVIYLANNAVAHKPLDFEAEADAIREELERDEVDGELPLYVDTAATTDELHEALLQAPNAQVLHLAGHGGETAGLLMVDPDGHPVGIKGTDLARVLATFPNIRLVVLSACRLLEHAKRIAEIVPCVVATSLPLDDVAARRFARAFYKELARGGSVGHAFERGAGIVTLDHPDPKLVLEERTHIKAWWITVPPIATSGRARAIDKSDSVLKAAFDGYEDMVLFGNITGTWEGWIPHPEGAEPEVRELQLERDRWQTRYPLDHAQWSAGVDEVLAAGRAALKSRRHRVHVLANMPYSLGAVLAASLEQQSRDLMFYQEAPVDDGASDQRVWQPWGPAFKAARPASDRVVFNNARLPARPINRTLDVGVLCHISRRIDTELARRAIDAVDDQVQLVSMVPEGGSSATALNISTIDQAATELSDLIQKLPEHFPQARAYHLFYSGPLVLLMRAVGRVHLLPKPVYFYEWFAKTPTGAQYVRTVDLRDRRLVIDGRHTR